MNKQLRNRRSASTCSNYSQHSVSMVNLDTAGQTGAREGPRQRKIQYAQIQRAQISLYQELKKYSNPNQEKTPQKQTILKWRRALKLTIEHNRQCYRSLTHSIATLKLNLSQLQQNKDTEIRNIKASQVEELKLLENQMSKKIIDVNGDFSRREQEYRETISKFIDTLHKSQRNWSKIYTEISGKLKKAQELFKQRVEIDNKNHEIYEQIASFTNEIYAQHDQSLGSINLSYDELAIHAPVKQLQSRRNTIDISSIEQISENEVEEAPAGWGFENCLIQLIYWGFFLQKNQGNIKKLMSITKDLQNPEQIVKQPIFPILIESIKLQLNLDKEISSMVEDNSGMYYENQDRVIMRDIENQID